MVQKSVNSALKENLDKKVNSNNDTSNYFHNENYESEAGYQDNFGIIF